MSEPKTTIQLPWSYEGLKWARERAHEISTNVNSTEGLAIAFDAGYAAALATVRAEIERMILKGQQSIYTLKSWLDAEQES